MPGVGADRPDTVTARFFFTQGSSLVEDPATGSAAAGLGGLLASQGERGLRFTITQGAAVARPCLLTVDVGADGTVTVGGRVHHVGSGSLTVTLGDQP